MADGRIGQQPLQVILEQRHDRADAHRGEARGGHDPEPLGRPRQHRPQPRHQEDPGLHHGRGMQVGADRRRGRHRARQPEMERELRRLGERADQDQDQRRDIEGRGPDRLARQQDVRKLVRPRDLPQQQEPRDHRQPPHPRHDQRHARALPRLGLVPPVANEQERRQRGEFPHHQQQQDVVAEDDPQHRALEQHQVGEEPPRRVARIKIEPRIEDDEQPDPEDQDPEQQPQPVQPEACGKADLRQPVDPRGHDLARQHRRGMQAQPDQRRQREQRAGAGRDAAARPHQQSGNKGAKERQRGDQRRGHGTS